MTRLVDPVHLFDGTGFALLDAQHLKAENERLSAENERLKRRVALYLKRDGQSDEAEAGTRH